VSRHSIVIEDFEHSAPASAIDIRNALAVERTRLAAERTYAAWLRTGLAALASGAGAHSLLEGIVSARLNRIISSVLILFAVFCFVAGVWREVLANRAWAGSAVSRMTPSILCVVSAVLTMMSLTVMVGLWHRR
jgi:putative membrane protein